MKKILQINVVSNYGSTGKIALGIENEIIKKSWKSYIAYGRDLGKKNEKDIKIGNKLDNYIHVLGTRIFDKHGLYSEKSTKIFIKKIQEINPDIIHLHVIHGYYLNYKILFDYINLTKTPVIWTLHDCWAFTGHCSYFEYINCSKWKDICHKCEQIYSYPRSLIDNSKENFLLKKEYFTKNPNIHLVPVSNWLSNILEDSFLSKYPKTTIHNGIDLNTFNIKKINYEYIKSLNINFQNKNIILAVASVWEQRKGLKDLIKLYKILPKEYQLVIVGLSKNQIKTIPKGIISILRTENIEQLVSLYNIAKVFVNTTLEDTFPTVNLESLACGTPIVTYKTGGSPESIDEKTGFVVEKSNIYEILESIKKIISKPEISYQENCRKRAEEYFDKNKNFKKYINLYEQILNNK